MTSQLRNEQHLAVVIDLLHQVIEAQIHEAELAESNHEKRYIINRIAALSGTAEHLNVIMRTYDLPYQVDDNPPDWRG